MGDGLPSPGGTTLRTTLRAAVAALSLAAVMAPTAAFAASETIDDAKGDVWKVDFDDQGAPAYSEDGSVANVDVDSSKVSHSAKRISLAVDFHTLKKSSTSPLVQLLAQTDDGSEYYMYAYAFDGENGWETGAFVGENTEHSRGGTMCEGVKSHVDFDKDRMTVSAPRACFGSPAWIKANVASNGSRFTESGITSWYDNGHNKSSSEHKPWTDKIKKG